MTRHPFLARIDATAFAHPYGHVTKLADALIEATGPAASLGDLCDIDCGAVDGSDRGAVAAEIVAIDDRRVVLVPLEGTASIALRAKVKLRSRDREVPVGDAFAGRAIDALGRPVDGRAAIVATATAPLDGTVPRPMERIDPSRILHTGLRAIDGLLTLGIGQRVGVFAASGGGKTGLMEQVTTQIEADRVVLCLVGERGREVEALWGHISARPNARRYTLVAATSDESAAMRARAVPYALALAEHWRARGEHVVLMIDSITRMAMALREIGLASGAPPTVRAYTPNVFALLPRVVERCGAIRGGGSITAIMTVLSETDDVDDPIVELMKSLLDGHIVLSRALAEQGHFPAIDVARSISRRSERLVSSHHAASVRDAVAMVSAYEEARVMIESGVYKSGTNVHVDRAIASRTALSTFLRQSRSENTAFDSTVDYLARVVATGPASA